jgi:hypothetical protein
VNLGDLSFPAVDAALRTTGVVIAFGPFAVRFKIREHELARALYHLYAGYPLVDPEQTVLFSEVRVVPERLWSDFFRRGFAIYADGELHGRSLDLPLALPSVEWTINWRIATRAHRYAMIHAAVAEREGRALILPGDPGSGKSTLCAALVGRGWRLLSDEFALLRPEDGMLMPMPRPMSLKNQSIGLIRAVAPHLRFGPAVSGTTKGTVALAAPPAESILRQGEPARPQWIIFPAWREEATAPELKPLSRSEAFADLTDNGINYDIIGEAGFRAFRGLVESCAAYRLTFGRLTDALDVVDSLDRQTHAGGVPADARAR